MYFTRTILLDYLNLIQALISESTINHLNNLEPELSLAVYCSLLHIAL